MMPVRWVFFDVGDTLVHLSEPMVSVLLRHAGAAGVDITADDLAQTAQVTRTRLAQRAATRRPFSFPPAESRRFWMSIYRHVIGRRTSPDVANEVATQVYAHFSSPAAYALHSDVVPTLTALRAAGIRLGIISNWEAWIHDLLAHHDLARWFEIVVASSEVEIEKPDRRIFDIALARTGLAPGEMLYVGDSPVTDVAGAARAGWMSALIARDAAVTGSEHATTLRDLRELPTMLGIPEAARASAAPEPAVPESAAPATTLATPDGLRPVAAGRR